MTINIHTAQGHVAVLESALDKDTLLTIAEELYEHACVIQATSINGVVRYDYTKAIAALQMRSADLAETAQRAELFARSVVSFDSLAEIADKSKTAASLHGAHKNGITTGTLKQRAYAYDLAAKKFEVAMQPIREKRAQHELHMTTKPAEEQPAYAEKIAVWFSGEEARLRKYAFFSNDAKALIERYAPKRRYYY